MSAAARVGCVLVAAGSGTRLGQGIPKALVRVEGRTLLEHAVEAVATANGPASNGPASNGPASSGVDALVVVVPHEQLATARALVLASWRQVLGDHPDRPDHVPVEPVVVVGGRDRQESVRLGLAALPPAVEVVLVHDAARAFAPASLLHRVTAAVTGDVVAVVPGLPVTDTIKLLAPPTPGTTTRAVERTLERAALVAVQTPQGFRADVLRAVHAAAAPTAATGPTDAGPGAGDDAGMVEDAGHAVVVVAGDPDAFKVTTPHDLHLAEALLARRHADRPAHRDERDQSGPGVIPR